MKPTGNVVPGRFYFRHPLLPSEKINIFARAHTHTYTYMHIIIIRTRNIFSEIIIKSLSKENSARLPNPPTFIGSHIDLMCS